MSYTDLDLRRHPMDDGHCALVFASAGLVCVSAGAVVAYDPAAMEVVCRLHGRQPITAQQLA